MSEQLVEQIYEAAFVPEAWPALLDTLAARIGASGAGLIIDRADSPPITSSTEALQEALSEYCSTGGWQTSELTTYARGAAPASFLLDEDFFPPEMMRREAAGALIPLGVGALLGTVFPMPSGETAVIMLQRRPDAPLSPRQALAWLNTVRPHLGRAALIAGRLQLERAADTVKTLARLGLPAAVLTAGTTVLVANSLFEALRSPFRIGAFDRLSLIGQAADRLFKDAAMRSSIAPSVRSIPIPARDNDPAMIIHVAPVERRAHDIFNQAACIVIVTPLGGARVPDTAMLNGLFDLTPAEARLVQTLANGLTINQAAGDMDLSVTTLRTQLRSVFAKTGTSRQTELSRLIGSMGMVKPAP